MTTRQTPDAVRELTTEERNAIRSLQRLAKRWPPSLWLFSGAGSLCVMLTGEDGKKMMTAGDGIDPDYSVATINIPNDGGDW